MAGRTPTRTHHRCVCRRRCPSRSVRAVPPLAGRRARLRHPAGERDDAQHRGRRRHPDARIVLLKGLDDRGLVFYTHRTSRQGPPTCRAARGGAHVLLGRPRAAGARAGIGVEWTTDAESDEYFRSRPRSSQLGAIVSNQSAIIPGRDSLEEALAELAGAHRRRSARAPGDLGRLPRPARRNANSGRDGRAGCTIASATGRMRTATGRANGSRRSSAWSSIDAHGHD